MSLPMMGTRDGMQACFAGSTLNCGKCDSLRFPVLEGGEYIMPSAKLFGGASIGK